MITFNTDGMVAQRFPFPAPIMDYILKNLQPQHLVKLYQCCKFFYTKYPQNIICHLTLVDEYEHETFDPTSTIICATNPALKKLKDFWISDSFVYFAPLNYNIIMPYFSHCTIKKLDAGYHLTWEEYEALTKAGTVQELKVGRIYRNGVLVHIEDIIAAVPNAKSIEVTESILALTSFAALIALDHQVKITKFVLGNVENTSFRRSDVFKFLDLLQKHADLDCVVHFDYKKLIGDHDTFRILNQSIEKVASGYNKILAVYLEEKKLLNLALK